MSYRLLAIALVAATICCGSCKKRQPSVKKTPAEEQQSPTPPPDSLQGIGLETAGLVKVWVEILKQVNTEEDVAPTIERLDKLSDQFGYLLQRAERLAPLGQTEFKRIDAKIDPLIREAASGLESHTQRIFLLPKSIRSQVLPANQKLMENFQNMSRAIRNSQSKADEAPQE